MNLFILCEDTDNIKATSIKKPTDAMSFMQNHEIQNWKLIFRPTSFQLLTQTDVVGSIFILRIETNNNLLFNHMVENMKHKTICTS